MNARSPWHIPRSCDELGVCQARSPACSKCAPRVSEGSISAARLWAAIRPLPGTVPPDVGLRPYMLTRHSHARVDTHNAPAGAMAVSNPATLPLGTRLMEQRG
ncbi:hypothetical protein [Hydrogenophaga sp.]|uniref:hypothetical protein n=1 Tax=Hydrogenophaga sp. TaxID=1904254 RepID=UPI00272F805D|nr:hypothetical protein [Hydrogenophaga sp.]MDP1686858.1 hypothetical protein [Hydrogenophaga sp.]